MKNILFKIFFSVLLISALFISIIILSDSSPTEISNEKEIKIGLIAPLTGSSQKGGLSMKKGVELAVKNINDNGGIGSYKLSLDIYDDSGIPDLSIEAAKKLIFIDNVSAIIGPFNSDCCIAIKGLINSCEVPLITPVAMSDEINRENDYIFRNTLGVSMSQAKVNDFVNSSKGESLMLEGLDSSSIGILWQSDTWGYEMQQLVVDDMVRLGKENTILFNEPFALNQNSYENIYEKYKLSFPDLIYIVSAGDESITLVKDGRDSGFMGLFYGEGGFNYSNFDTELGAYADGCLFSTQWHPTFSTPMSDVFVKLYLTEYNEAPDMFAAISYESVYILKDSLAILGNSTIKL
jgi:branched-chain amino acid transport system substrate-binding protein